MKRIGRGLNATRALSCTVCTVLHCNHLRNTWKPLVLHDDPTLDYCLSASEGDNQSVRSSAPVVSRCFLGGYNVKLYISRGRLAWLLLVFWCCDYNACITLFSLKLLGVSLQCKECFRPLLCTVKAELGRRQQSKTGGKCEEI